MKTVHEKLRRLMALRNLTQEGLADALGITHSTVGRWLHHKSKPYARNEQKIADYFGIDLAVLVDDQKDLPELQEALRAVKTAPEKLGRIMAIQSLIRADFTRRIQILRNEKGGSMTAVAQALDVSRTAIYDAINGKVPVSDKMFRKLHEAEQTTGETQKGLAVAQAYRAVSTAVDLAYNATIELQRLEGFKAEPGTNQIFDLLYHGVSTLAEAKGGLKFHAERGGLAQSASAPRSSPAPAAKAKTTAGLSSASDHADPAPGQSKPQARGLAQPIAPQAAASRSRPSRKRARSAQPDSPAA